MLILPLAVVTAATYAYVFVVAAGSLAFRVPFFRHGGFSWPKFYTLMGWVPLGFGLIGVVFDLRYLAFFVVAAVAGIVGEVLVSIAYERYVGAPIWTYGYGALQKGYTSTLNVLPWAFGGLLFQQLGRIALVAPPAGSDVSRAVLVSAVALVGGCALLWPLRGLARAPRGELTVASFALFCAPIAVVALSLGLFASPAYAVLMGLFSVLGFSTEYAYGRIMSLFFDEPLWRYTHFQIDGGHTSFVTLPLWALGGLYFHLLAALLGL